MITEKSTTFVTGDLLSGSTGTPRSKVKASYICRMKILMVCLGNICRSPLAEGILREKAMQAGLDWEIDSAGTSGHMVGCPPHRQTQKIALEHGIDLSAIRCRNFTKNDILQFDKIYVMDEENYVDVQTISGSNWDPGKVDYLLNAIYPGENRSVPDPWYGGEKGFYAVHELVDKACEAIVKKHTIKNRQPL